MARGDRPLERVIQRQVVAYLTARGIRTAHVPNGSQLAGGAVSRARQMNALKADGLRAGFPDLILLSKHGVGFLEVKREGEKLSDRQTVWRAEIEELNLPWACVRSVDDVKETLAEWGWA